jgi:hypothetical protein
MPNRFRATTLVASSVLFGLLTGCSDDLSRSPSEAALTSAMTADCGVWCPVAVGRGAFEASRGPADSLAFPVALATYAIRAEAGASVTLRLDASAGWWALLPPSATLVIEAGGVKQLVPLVALQGDGHTVLLSSVDMTFLTISVTRLTVQPSDGDPRLLMHLTKSAVLRRFARWDGLGALAGGSFVTASGTNCSFNAPGTWCGVVVGITPFAQGTAWTQTGFQSQSGSGPSTTITVTFSQPIQSFAVDVYDPDFNGNQVVAKDGSGATLATVPVTGDNSPGSFTLEHVSINVPGIRTITLIPAAADYIAFDQAVFSAPDTFVVACLPNPVVRGAQVTCSPVPATPSTVLTVSGWQFVGPELSAPVTSTSTSLQWTGIAATSGVVSATGTIDGVTTRGSGTLTVSNRNWTQDTVQYAINNLGALGLTSQPKAAGDLGNTSPNFLILPTPTGVTNISSGPNTGVLFYNQVPARAQEDIRINYVALSVGSAFYSKQPTSGPQTKCKRVDVPPFVPVAEAHEGTLLQAMSHTFVFRSKVNLLIPPLTEPIVALNDAALLDAKATTATNAAFQAALTASADASMGGTVPPITYRSPTDLCNFAYFK